MQKKVIKKALIPMAGLGTRFLPATKSIPKEMFPVVDRPILLYIVEEALSAGIEEFVFITGRGKESIESFFDHSVELEKHLEAKKNYKLLEMITNISKMANVTSIRQKEPLGLGHAILKGRSAIGQDPFVVLLGDELFLNSPHELSVTQKLCKHYEETQESVVAVMNVDKKDVSKYGIIQSEPVSGQLHKVLSVVEKPSPEEAPSQLALPGRYVFESNIFDFLEEAKPSVNGEIQLTSAMTEVAQNSSMFAIEMENLRFDAGDKFGYIKAIIEFGLIHDEVGPLLKQYLDQRKGTLS